MSTGPDPDGRAKTQVVQTPSISSRICHDRVGGVTPAASVVTRLMVNSPEASTREPPPVMIWLPSVSVQRDGMGENSTRPRMCFPVAGLV
jgi:hypothetical protein